MSVIEELQWNQPGSYIRGRIQELQLDKVIRHGRIWRVSYDGMPRDTRQPRMLNETPAQLVAACTRRRSAPGRGRE